MSPGVFHLTWLKKNKIKHMLVVCDLFKGAGRPSGGQPHDAQAPEQVLDSGQLWRHVSRSQPQRVGPLWQDNTARLLGAQLRLLTQLLLQRVYQQVTFQNKITVKVTERPKCSYINASSGKSRLPTVQRTVNLHYIIVSAGSSAEDSFLPHNAS